MEKQEEEFTCCLFLAFCPFWCKSVSWGSNPHSSGYATCPLPLLPAKREQAELQGFPPESRTDGWEEPEPPTISVEA